MTEIERRAQLRTTLRQHPRVLARVRRVRRLAHPLALLESRTQARERLVERPVFVLSSVRSGSTLLRLLLDAHPQIRAPHELHLNAVSVTATGVSAMSMAELGFTDQRLQFLLWDRILHRELLAAGAQVIVDKTPSNSKNWRKLLRCWPDARFIVLRRHPAAIAASWRAARAGRTEAEVEEYLLPYLTGMDEAYTEHGGLLTRYEDLTRDPTAELTRICGFLDLPFEPTMLDYAARAPVENRRGLGDWSAKLRSGQIHAGNDVVDPDRMPEALRPFARAWGYL